MKINNLQYYNTNSYNNFKNNNNNDFIDKFLSKIKNPDDINNCVAVPRGIFKAYLWIMSGSGLNCISNALPNKFSKSKFTLSIIGNIFNIISAYHFAKGFIFKNLSPTIKKDSLNI